MPTPVDRSQVECIKESLREAWREVFKLTPDETVYAFGVSTTESAESFRPFACGEVGLRQVAARYVKKKTLSSVDDACEELRWSFDDSPYDGKLSPTADMNTAFASMPPTWEYSGAAGTREIRRRLEVARTAILELEQEGLFGTGKERERITLMIVSGDCASDWLLGWTKRLNPPKVFKAFKDYLSAPEMVGKFTDYGKKKVDQTTAVSASADGRLVATASGFHFFVFDMNGPEQVVAIKAETDDRYRFAIGVAVAADGKLIALTTGNACSLQLLSGAKWRERVVVELQHQPCCLAVHPHGDWTAVGDDKNMISVYSPAGELKHQLRGHGSWLRDLAVSPDGSLLASGDSEHGVQIWKTTDWSLMREIDEPTDRLDFDPTGRYLVGCLEFGRPTAGRTTNDLATRARIYDVATGRMTREVRVAGFEVHQAAFSPEGTQLACSLLPDGSNASANEAALVDIETGAVRDRLKGGFGCINALCFLPQRKEIAVAVRKEGLRPLVLWQVSGT
jgi:hypothetical protein